MPRIRSIKPSFFRHEDLQYLELKFPEQYIMLTFAGLWTLCYSKGVFEYKPTLIKLDILSENGFLFRHYDFFKFIKNG